MRRLTLLVLLLSVPSLISASEPVTMSDFVGAAREVAEKVGLEQRDPERSEELENNLSAIEGTGVDLLPVAQVAAGLLQPGPMMLSRSKRDEYGASLLGQPYLKDAVDRVQQIINGEYRTYQTAAGREAASELDGIMGPLTAYHKALLDKSLEIDREKLRRFEKKFGPNAPKLNALEVGLNFIAQRFPGFRPNDRGPGAWEVIAAYDTGYLTLVDEEPAVVSTAGFGLRYYLLGNGWGEADGLAGMLKPGHASAGVLLAPNEDGALLWPWQGEERIGGFVTWGALKLAYVGGDEERFMVSREFQAIPWLF
jgi:hypothetical protein